MQPIPGLGPRNPNGHTRQTILDALHGVSGSIRWDFRYELLDSSNVKLRDLDSDEIEANTGVVNFNNLAEIKRDLQFRARAGTSIDWLSDRIKPWARLHIPPYGPSDWVEWPLGVFLPVTPTRAADATSAVWRDVEAYDQGIILQEDQLPDRYSTEGHLDAEDGFLRDITGAWGFPDLGPQWAQSVVAGTTYGVTTAGGGYAYATLTANRSLVRLNAPSRRYRDGEVYARIGVSQTTTGGAQIPAVLLRMVSSSVYYRVRLHFLSTGLVSVVVTNGTTQVGSLTATGVSYTPGSWVHVRARIVGQTVQGRVWADGAPEPAEWTVEEEITTAQIADGFFGFSASCFNDNTNTDPQLRYELFELDANPTNLVTGHVRRVLEQGGIVQHRITPSEEVLPTVREWEPGTPRGQIVGDLLGSINYRSLSFDEDGVAVAEPYIPPGERAAEFSYLDDQVSIMDPSAVHELDLHAIPNQWVGSVSEPDRAPLTVTFTNRDPASPTSVPRRGRTITDFRTEQDATSESALIEQVARVAAESSQVYEALDFTTALNPLHSHDDVYRIRRDDLALDALYTGHTWELPLDPSGVMRHRARRVVAFSPVSDPSIVVGDAQITGAVQAGNIATGTTTVSPVANTPNLVQITGLDLQGRGPVRVYLTAATTVPGSTVREIGFRNATPTGFDLWVWRSNTTNTPVQWCAIREA